MNVKDKNNRLGNGMESMWGRCNFKIFKAALLKFFAVKNHWGFVYLVVFFSPSLTNTFIK